MSEMQAALGSPFFSSPMAANPALAQGILSAGNSLGNALNYMNQLGRRSSAADGVLETLHANKSIDDKTYQAVAGKSLEAKEAVIGMHTTMALQAQKGQVETGTQTAAIQQTGEQQRQNIAAEVQKQLELFRGTKLMPQQPTATTTPVVPPQPGAASTTSTGQWMQAKTPKGWIKFQHDGNGNATSAPIPIDGQESGIPVYGQQ